MAKRSEFTEQCAVISWAGFNKKKWPALEYLNASLSGVYLPINLAMQAKRSGMVSGFPDLFLPYHNGTFSGLFIEMKYGKNKVSPQQKKWIKWLNSNHYHATVAYGAEEAVGILTNYLENKIGYSDNKK
jgi:hypothetical protein